MLGYVDNLVAMAQRFNLPSGVRSQQSHRGLFPQILSAPAGGVQPKQQRMLDPRAITPFPVRETGNLRLAMPLVASPQTTDGLWETPMENCGGHLGSSPPSSSPHLTCFWAVRRYRRLRSEFGEATARAGQGRHIASRASGTSSHSGTGFSVQISRIDENRHVASCLCLQGAKDSGLGCRQGSLMKSIASSYPDPPPRTP